MPVSTRVRKKRPSADLKAEGWVGFDLDGTLAHYTPDNFDPLLIGPPVEAMLKTLKWHLDQGDPCFISTARVSHPHDSKEKVEQIRQAIRDWTEAHCGEALECRDKDYLMKLGYDDRIRQVIPNTGITMGQLVAMLRRRLQQLDADFTPDPEVEQLLQVEDKEQRLNPETGPLGAAEQEEP